MGRKTRKYREWWGERQENIENDGEKDKKIQRQIERLKENTENDEAKDKKIQRMMGRKTRKYREWWGERQENTENDEAKDKKIQRMIGRKTRKYRECWGERQENTENDREKEMRNSLISTNRSVENDRIIFYVCFRKALQEGFNCHSVFFQFSLLCWNLYKKYECTISMLSRMLTKTTVKLGEDLR